MKAKRRVVTSPGVRAPGTRRRPTIRRIKPAIEPLTGRRPAGAAPSPAPDRPAAAGDANAHGSPIDLTVDVGRGLRLANPVLAASGCFGYGVEHGDLLDVQALGALCTRGTTLRARPGNATPRMARVPGGLLNAVGLQNPGVDAVIERYAGLWAGWRVPVIVNVAGESVSDFAEVARRLDGLAGIAALELNLSCPDAARGGLLFGSDATAAGSVTAAVRRATDLPLLVKLSPAVADVRPIARAVADAGADTLTAVNTVPGLATGGSRERPLLGSTYGGLSGPAIRPIAMRVVYEVAQVVDIPLIAAGGVVALADVLDYLALGAAAVQVGTAALADPALPTRLADELAAEVRRRVLATYRPLIGTALPARRGPSSATGAEYRP
jgi:dihydroorotate dehydrogenase (NAD+) catalytic subunit